jgi:O-antigen/teichoic acid export membrane protein
LLLVWTHNSTAAAAAGTIASLLLLGTAINGLISVPSFLQFAAGWPRLVLTYNAVAVVVMVPLLMFMASRFGGVGAAIVWVSLNAGHLLVTVPLMHRRLLPGHRLRWYRDDFARPVIAAAAIGLLFRLAMPRQLNTLMQAAYLCVVGIVLTVVVATVLPEMRIMATVRLRALRNAYVA